MAAYAGRAKNLDCAITVRTLACRINL
jgi:hypothetical protein